MARLRNSRRGRKQSQTGGGYRRNGRCASKLSWADKYQKRKQAIQAEKAMKNSRYYLLLLDEAMKWESA